MSLLFGTLPDLPNAACAYTSNPDKFFPKNQKEFEDNSHLTLGLCGSCIEREACLQFALDNDEEHGVWGGLSPAQRERIAPKRERTSSRIRHIKTVRGLMRNGMSCERACQEAGITVATYMTYETKNGHQVLTPASLNQTKEKDKK
jgi:WhiB family redox-sensing transcriptional regulator